MIKKIDPKFLRFNAWSQINSDFGEFRLLLRIFDPAFKDERKKISRDIRSLHEFVAEHLFYILRPNPDYSYRQFKADYQKFGDKVISLEKHMNRKTKIPIDLYFGITEYLKTFIIRFRKSKNPEIQKLVTKAKQILKDWMNPKHKKK